MRKRNLVLIPAYNEEKNIKKTIEGVIERNKGVDVLVVNDGSRDSTLSEIRKTKALVISHPFNMGYGVALQTGYKFAWERKYEKIVQIDADGQHDPKYIKRMIDKLGGECDVLIGSRFKKDTGYRATWSRRVGMVVFRWVVSRVIGQKMTDVTSGYQSMKRSVLPFLVSEFFPCDFPDADLMIMLHLAGYKIREMPMKMYENETGQSMHKGIFKNLYYVMKMGLSIFTVLLRRTTGLSNK